MGAPHTRQELVDILREARVGQGLSLRAVARQVGLPASTLQGWFEGRHLPTIVLQDDFVRLLGVLGLDDDTDAWLRSLDRLRNGGEIGANPYPGIRSFTAEESENFFGRERILGELVAAIKGVQTSDWLKLVAVVGLSGSGKSSLLNAGLVGRECQPGGRLAEFTPVAVEVDELSTWSPPGEGATLLIVDHLERLRSMPQEEREAALAVLGSLPGNVTGVFALVADAFEFAIADENLRQALSAPVLLSALDDDEFEDITRRPAQQSGRPMEEALVGLVLRDLKRYGPPGAQVLPLLSNALFRAWEHATGPVVTVADFLGTGGIWGSLERSAEALYADASQAEQLAMRRLFLSLVQVASEGIERRPVEISAIPEDELAVADRFLETRLLSLQGTSLTVSHSALIGRWKRLNAWVDEERELLHFRRRLTHAADLWREANRDPQALIPIEALLYDRLASNENIVLGPLESEFFEASVARAEEQHRESEEEVGRLRRRYALITVLAASALVLAIVAGVLWARADHFRRHAEEARAEAQSRQLALTAEETRPSDRNVAAQLAIAAYRTSPTLEAQAAVLKSAGLQAPFRIAGAPGTVRLASSEDGSLLAKAGSDGRVSLWREGRYEAEPTNFPVGDGQLFGLALGRNGDQDLLAVAGQGIAGIWDVTAEPRKLAEIADAGEMVAYSAAFGGGSAYFGMLDGTVRKVPADGGPTHVWRFNSDAPVEALAASPDGRIGIAGGVKELGLFIDEVAIPGPVFDHNIRQASFNEDASLLVVGGAGGEAHLLSVEPDDTIKIKTTFDVGPLTVHSVDISDDKVVFGSWDGKVYVFGLDGEPLGTVTGPSPVTGLALMAGRLATGSLDGAVRIWPERYAGLLIEGSDNASVADFDSAGIVKFHPSWAGVYSLGGELLRRVDLGREFEAGFGASLIRDAQLSTGAHDGRMATWDIAGSDGPVWSSISDRAPLFLESGPDNLALWAEPSVDRATIIKRSGRTWARVADISTWSTLAMGWHPTEPVLAAMSVDSTQLLFHDLSGDTPEILGSVDVPKTGASVRLTWVGPDRVVVGTDAGLVFVVDTTDLTKPVIATTTTDVTAAVGSIAVSDDGSVVAAGLNDGRIVVWDFDGATLSTRALLRPSRGSIGELALHDGQVVFATDAEGIYAWPLNPEEAAAQLCKGIGAPLSAEEWRQLAPGVAAMDPCG